MKIGELLTGDNLKSSIEIDKCKNEFLVTNILRDSIWDYCPALNLEASINIIRDIPDENTVKAHYNYWQVLYFAVFLFLIYKKKKP